ncbi:MAG: hypothetical protein BWY98_00809 [Tenericutes bacterium ADurb.BinA155]|nr:MAG: hypothetical protein BWY98_00809 [Tenericutes bacterium ADurb.BinA155]
MKSIAGKVEEAELEVPAAEELVAELDEAEVEALVPAELEEVPSEVPEEVLAELEAGLEEVPLLCGAAEEVPPSLEIKGVPQEERMPTNKRAGPTMRECFIMKLV